MNGWFIRRLNTRTCEQYQNVISTDARIQGEHSSSICSALSRRGCGWWAGRLEWVTQPKVCRAYLSPSTDDAYQIIARWESSALLTWRSRSSSHDGLNCHPSISALRSLHCVYIEQYHRVKENLCDNIYCFVSLEVSALNVVVIVFFKSPQGVGNVNCIR